LKHDELQLVTVTTSYGLLFAGVQARKALCHAVAGSRPGLGEKQENAGSCPEGVVGEMV